MVTFFLLTSTMRVLPLLIAASTASASAVKRSTDDAVHIPLHRRSQTKTRTPEHLATIAEGIRKKYNKPSLQKRSGNTGVVSLTDQVRIATIVPSDENELTNHPIRTWMPVTTVLSKLAHRTS